MPMSKMQKFTLNTYINNDILDELGDYSDKSRVLITLKLMLQDNISITEEAALSSWSND